MQIIFDSSVYNVDEPESFKNLIARLRSAKISTNVCLQCKNHTTSDLDKFNKNLIKVTPPLSFAVSLVTEEENQRIYEFERIKFQTERKIEQLKSYINDPKNSAPKISEYKLAMVNKEHSHIPQKQTKIISINSHSLKVKEDSAPIPVENNKTIPLFNGDKSELINIHNINKLSNEYVEIFSNASSRQSLEDIWRDLFGSDGLNLSISKTLMLDCLRYYAKVKNIPPRELTSALNCAHNRSTEPQCTLVHDDSSKQFESAVNFPKMSNVILLDALPIVVDKFGKIVKVVKLKSTDDDTRVLDYDTDINNDDVNVFAPQFYIEESLPSLPNINDYKKFFGETSKAVQGAYWELFTKKEDAKFLDHIITLVNSLGFSSDEIKKFKIELFKFDAKIKNLMPAKFPIIYNGLADVLLTSGFYGLFLVLRQINNFDFGIVADFIDSRQNLIQFASKEGLDKLSVLASLSDADKLWWKELVKRHKNSGNSVDFTELFLVFHQLRTELGVIGSSLPTPFPFAHLESFNMQAAAKIIIQIVNNSQSQDQLHLLEGLSLDLDDAYLASKQNNLRILTKEMGLQKSKAFADRTYNAAAQDFQAIMQIPIDPTISEQDKKNQYELRSNYYYRFIARKDAPILKRFKYENFLAIGNYIDTLNTELMPKIDVIKIQQNLENTINFGLVLNRDKQGKPLKLQFVCDQQSVDLSANDLSLIQSISKDFKEGCAVEELLKHNFENEKFQAWLQSYKYQNFDLSYVSRSALLYIAAVAGTGQGACLQASTSTEELVKFLHAIQLFADKFNINNREDILNKIHEIGLDVKTCPSLSELTTIINKLSATNSTHDGLELISSAFTIIKNHGEDAVEIFANISEGRNKTLSTGDFLINYTKSLDRDWPYLAKASSVFSEPIETNQLEELRYLQMQYLLRKLAMIDVVKSSAVLTKDHLSGLVARIKNITDEKQLHSEVQKYFQEQKLNIKFNSEGVARSKISLVDSIKILIKLYNTDYTKIRGWIDKGLYTLSFASNSADLIKAGLDEVNSYVQEIAQAINIEPIDENILLKIFDKADLRLSFIKDDLVRNNSEWVINQAKSVVLGMVGRVIDEDQRPYIEAYFNTFSLVVFMDKAIAKSIENTIITLVTDVFGGKKTDDFNEYLIEYIKEGGKPIRFGMVEADSDPRYSQSEYIKSLLRNVDGIVKYQDSLYYIQQDEPLKIRELVTNSPAIDKLKAKISKEYKCIGVDGFRVINLDLASTEINLGADNKIETAIYLHVRNISLQQDAIVLYKGKYYYFDFIAQKVTLQDSPRLQELFKTGIVDREATAADEAIFRDVIGELHDEHALLSELDIKPILFPSQNIDKYNKKLDVFTDILNTLNELKERDFDLFTKYFEIFKGLKEYVSVNDLIQVVNLFKKLLANDENSLLLVYERLNDLYIKIDHLKPKSISLKSLQFSLEQLESYSNLDSSQLNPLLDNLIPFTLQGAEFPVDIFLNNQNQSKEFLNDLLTIAAEVSNSGGKDFFENINKVKQVFAPDNIEPILSALFKALVVDKQQLATYKELLAKVELLPKDKISVYSNIFQALNSLQNVENIIDFPEISKILDGINKHQASLDKLHNICYKREPYLAKSRLIIELEKSSAEFNDFLNYFDNHPYLEANQQKAEPSFSTERVLDIIQGITRLPNNVPLTYDEQVALTKEFAYVNSISRGQSPLYLQDKDNNPIYLHKFNSKSAVVNTEDLMQIAKRLREEFCTSASQDKTYLSDPSDKTRRRIALQYIAVMRELYYRSTGIIPNSTQIITIINALNGPCKQLEEIDTAEGKSVTTALFSALLCARGCTVLVPTSSKNLVIQDYFVKHNNLFFAAMGFESLVIDQENPNSRFKPGAIHYGTTRDIDSLKAECEMLGVSITESEGKTYPLACVKDEQDSDLDDPASRSIAIENIQEDSLSPTWIISAINRFVESKNYQRIKTEKMSKQNEKEQDLTLEPDDEEQDLANLVRELRGLACKNKTSKSLASRQVDDVLPDLKSYLKAACQVHTYIEGIDYQVIERDLEGNYLANPIATPMNSLTSEVERGNTFPDSRQAFLHDLLNHSKKYPGREFKVELDPIEIDTKTNKSLAENFEYFIGLSATSGNKQEMLEVGMLVNKIPPHYKKMRDILAPIAVKDQAAKFQAIIDAVRLNGYEKSICPTFLLKILVSAIELYQAAVKILYNIFGKAYENKGKQPVVIFVENPVEAEKLYQKFSKLNNDYELQYITGKETREEYKIKTEKAGESDTISIVVPKDGRGIDYDSNHPQGIFGIKAFNSTTRGRIQVLGRVGRKGKPGKFLEIIDGCEFEYDSLFKLCFGLSLQQKREYVEAKEVELNSTRSIQRHYEQKLDEKIQVVLKHFDKIRLAYQNEENKEQLLLLRGKLLKNIRLILADYPFNYIKDGKVDIKGMQYAFDKVQVRLSGAWTEFLANNLSFLKDKNLEIDSYLQQNIAEEFIYVELEQSAAPALKPRLPKVTQDRTQRVIEQYVDGSYAILEFDEQFLSPDEIGKIKILKAAQQLKSLFKDFAWLGFDYTGDHKDILLNLDKVLKRIQNYLIDNPASAIKCYPIFKECLQIYKNIETYQDASMQQETNTKILSEWANFKKEMSYLEDNSTEEALKKQIFAYFTRQLGFIHKGLSLLGMKTAWLQTTYDNLLKLVKEDDIFKFYEELYRIQSLLDNDPNIFPFAKYLFGTVDLKKLLNETISYIDYLPEIRDSYAKDLNKAYEQGQCAGIFEAYLSDKVIKELTNRVDAAKLEDWKELIACFKKIREEQTGFAAVEELLAFFECSKIKEKSFSASSLTNVSMNFFMSSFNKIIHVSDYKIDPKEAIINKLQKIKSKIKEVERKRLNIGQTERFDTCFTQEHGYLESKQVKLKENITNLLKTEEEITIEIEELKILHGYSGNNQVYELRIKYSGDISNSKLLAKNDFVCLKEAEKLEKEQEKDLSKSISKYQKLNWDKAANLALIEKRKQDILNLQQEISKESYIKMFVNYIFSDSKQNKIIEFQNKITEYSKELKDLEVEISKSAVCIDLLKKNLERHKRYAGILVKKFNSLSELLDFEIKYLKKDDPRHLPETEHLHGTNHS